VEVCKFGEASDVDGDKEHPLYKKNQSVVGELFAREFLVCILI
jgi:hypothetical protein